MSNLVPFTNAHFAAFCLEMVGQPYWYGTCLYKCTESLRQRKARQYPSHYSASRTSRYQRDAAREKICADCIGGAKGYAWTNGGQGVLDSIGIPGSPKSKYASNGCPDKSANGMFKYAKSKKMPWGSIQTLPELPGLALHKDGHVGYYVGNGYAVEWRGFKYGCVRTKVANRGWKYWYQLPFIRYESTPAPAESTLGSRLLRRGMRGSDVKALQSALIRLGFALPKYGADGDFGRETESALKRFQKRAHIASDGEYGEISHAALMDALSDAAGEDLVPVKNTENRPIQDPPELITIPEIEPPPEAPEAPETKRKLIVTAAEELPVRCGNSADYARITTVSPNALLDYVATAENGWHAVIVGAQVGWIDGSFAQIVPE